jgi:excisionase family DNA binding protein
MSSTTNGVLLGVGEVAIQLGVSKATVWRLIREGSLPAIRLGDKAGQSVRIDAETLDRWLRDHEIR